MKGISDDELLDECLYIYDDNFGPLALHIYATKEKSHVRPITVFSDILARERLYRYRTSFLKIMDSLKEEIDKYKLLYALNNKEDIRKYDGLLSFVKNGDISIENLNEEDKKKSVKSIDKLLNTLKELKEVIQNGRV